MAKIVIDAREYTTTTGRYVYRLVQYLEKIDQTHDYVILLKPEDIDTRPFTNPRFTRVACPYKEFTLDEQLAFKKQLQGLKADLVHFGIVQQPVLYRGKVVTTMHDLTTVRFRNPSKNPVVFTIKQAVYKWVIKKAARKSTAIITPSKFVKDDIVKFTHVKPDKITVTYEAADPITNLAEPVVGLENRQFLMYVGRPMPHKNLRRLIEAFVRLKSSYPDLQLVLAGKKDANYESIEADVKTKGISGITFTGQISEGQLRWLYESCAAYVFPSLSEGFGLPGLEAMVQGAPVVSSNATCLPEIYGDSALYFNPLDINDMVSKINNVLSNPELRQSLITKGKLQAQRYSWQRMAEQTIEIYKQILGE